MPGDTAKPRAGNRLAGRGKVLLTGGILLAAAVIGYGVYSLVASRAYAAATEDYRQGDCREAIHRFEQVYGVYKLAVTSPTEEARARAAECRRLIAADRAVRGAEISAHPSDYAAALVSYQRLVQEVPSDAGVIRARAARGLDAAWSFKSDRNVCGPEPYLVSISAASELDARIRSQAERELPETTLTCARTLRRDREYQSAIDTYEALMRDYPSSRAATSGRTELIATRVDRYAARAGKGELPPPPVSGQGAAGSVEITIANGSPEPVELLFSGPAMSDSVRVPACGGCEEVSSGEESSSCSGAPSKTITIEPGRYRAVVRAPGNGSIKPFVGDWDLQSGYIYDDCYYIERES